MVDLNPRDIYREQVNTIFGLLPLTLLVDILAATILFAFVLLVTGNYSPLIYAWYAVVLITSSIRLLVAGYLKNRIDYGGPDSRAGFLVLSALVSGLLWGSTWTIMPIGSIEPPKGAIILWPCAVLAGAVANFAILRKLFLSLLLPTIALHVALLVYLGTEQDIQLAVALTVYGALLAVVAARIGNDLNLGIALKLQNRLLGDSLLQERDELKRKESELLRHIKREKALLAEKKQTDVRLEQAVEEKLLLLDAAGEGIFGTNKQRRVTFVNSMALKLLNFKEEDVLGQDALGLVCRDSRDHQQENTVRNSISDCFHDARSIENMKGNFFGKGNLVLPVNFSCRPIIKHEKFIGAVVSFFDMTKQIEMEAKLLQAQKMEAIGRITGGVAHDFNNLLTVIMGNLQFLKRRLSAADDKNEARLIEKIMSAAKRGAEMNNRLLSFSSEQALQSAPEDLNAILLDMQDFLKRTLGEEIEIVLNLTGKNCGVMIDRTRLENVILNICLNASDAMPDGGTVIIASHDSLRESGDSSTELVHGPGKYVYLTITDTGAGIPRSIQGKIFDPFFTTKPRGEGSGFGLSTAYGFIQQSGGDIIVQSEEGKGSIFTIHLPAVATRGIKAEERKETTTAVARYDGTVLVVEDDHGVRDIACQMLMEAGFNVLTASNGSAGLEQFNMHPDIDLVFSDIIMPGGMTGIELAEKILSDNPDVPILLATGYIEKPLKDQIAGIGNVVCIAKPYDTEKLPGMINSMLSKAAS
ncbi:MAG: ATP-binding protein [Pseudohongiellaceae bacterium]